MNAKRVAGVCAAIAVAAMGTAQAASAGTVAWQPFQNRGQPYAILSFTAAPGEINDTTAILSRAAATIEDPGNPLQPDPAFPDTSTYCEFSGDESVCRTDPQYLFAGAELSLGDGDDVGRMHATALSGGGDLDGGPGADVLYGSASGDMLVGGPGADDLYGGLGRDLVNYSADGDQTLGVNVTIDGVADDGRPGEHDNVRNDVEIVFGTDYGDNVLIGNAAGNTFYAGDGDDVLLGGAGNDELWGGLGPGPGGTNVIDGGPGLDSLVGGQQDDTIHARDGLPDPRISCGSGNDVVEADPIDEPDSDCETVRTG